MTASSNCMTLLTREGRGKEDPFCNNYVLQEIANMFKRTSDGISMSEIR